MTVLIVDDEAVLIEVLQEYLERHGVTCLSAQDLDEADLIRRSVTLDGVAVDLGARGERVLGWLEGLALEHPEGDLALVVMTGREPEAHELGRIVGIGARLLRKPFALIELREALESLPRDGDASERADLDLPPRNAPRRHADS